MMTMESVEPTIRERTTQKDEEQKTQDTVLSSKPLHRFVQTQPRTLGVAILIFRCADLLFGFSLAGYGVLMASSRLYVPLWQGVLFLVCGSLSIYTEKRPSKKMVTVCLSMYVVTILGIVVSVWVRIVTVSRSRNYLRWPEHDLWDIRSKRLIFATEAILVTSSLCVAILLIVLSVTARLALKSMQAQVIIRHISAPQRDTTPN